MKSNLLAFIALSTVLFHAYPAKASPRWDGVGLWVSNDENVNELVLRLPDGTYRSKEIQLYDYKKPPVYFSEVGKWWISRKKYVTTTDAISAAMWKRFAGTGKRWSCDIISEEKEMFTYFSTDGAIVQERKIGGADEAAFEKYPLELPTGAKVKWRMRDVTR